MVLQTKVKDAVQEQLIECNRIIIAAKRHVDRGLTFERLSSGREPTYDRRRRLAAVADSSHASAKSSYAFEGNLVFLQPECDAKAQSTNDYDKVLAASSVPGLSGRVHPLHWADVDIDVGVDVHMDVQMHGRTRTR